jgi:hypothetical protein
LSEECISLSPSLCSFLHFSVTSSLLGTNDIYYTKRKSSLWFFVSKKHFCPLHNIGKLFKI